MTVQSSIRNSLEKAAARCLIGLMLLLASLECSRSEEIATAPEYRIKAVYLFNFSQFVKWPASAFPGSNSPIVIGIVGESSLGAALEEAVAGETVNGHPIQLKLLAAGEDAGDCHVLFICRSEAQRAAPLLEKLKGKPVLTVGESDGFCDQGGIINFYQDGQKIKFEIKPQNADQAQLFISSKMLNLARIKSPAPGS